MSVDCSHLHARLSRVCFQLCLLLFLLGTAAAYSNGQDCPQTNAFYSKGDFKVRQVRVESPFNFLRVFRGAFNDLKAKMPQKAGDVFTVEPINDGKAIIARELDALEEGDDPRMKVRVIDAGYDRCDETTREVDVYYRIFTTNFNAYLSRTYEIKKEEVERSAAAAGTTAAENQTRGFFKIQPRISYNRSRQLFAGGRAGLRIPGSLFEAVEINGGVSTVGHDVEVEAAGAKSFVGGPLELFEYRVNFRHSDLPAGPNRIRSGLLRAQMFGASKPLGSLGVVVRFGASLEGGNLQTNLPTPAGTNSISSSGYGGLKTYVGATMRSKNIAMNASYGLQLATRGATTNIDFVKHIGDVAISGRWLVKSEAGKFHRALTLDARATGGAINTTGVVPVAERFFGGNVEKDFIEGDSWQIRSAPLIRSIPENRLNSITNGAIGATGFYSTNLTFSFPLWGKPLIPAEVATDPEFLPALELQKQFAKDQLARRYLADSPDLKELVTGLKAIDDEVKELDPFLQDPCEAPDDEEDDPRPEAEKARCKVKDLVKVVRLRVSNTGDLPGFLNALLVARDDDPTCLDPDIDTCSRLKTLRAALETWETNLPQSSSQIIAVSKRIRTSIETRQPALVVSLEKFEASPSRAEADRRAAEDMKPVETVLDSFINELNWFAIGPVGIFDVARVWPDPYGTRIGIGGGIRISIVNFNMTAGYAINARRRPNEDRGALFFSLDITELFR